MTMNLISSDFHGHVLYHKPGPNDLNQSNPNYLIYQGLSGHVRHLHHQTIRY